MHVLELFLWFLDFLHKFSVVLNTKSCSQIDYLQPTKKSRNTNDFERALIQISPARHNPDWAGADCRPEQVNIGAKKGK